MSTSLDLKESDISCIREISQGNKNAFESIIRRYNPYLYKIGRAYGFNHEDTEDLMQDAFISAYMNLRQFEERSTFRTWLSRIMINHCYHKKHKPERLNETLTTENLNTSTKPLFHNPLNPDQPVMNSELGLIIENALHTLPENYRMVFALRELNGNNVSETAQILNITESNVKVRLNRAKAMLRKAIEHTYSPEDIYAFNLIYCDKITHGTMKLIHQLALPEENSTKL